LKSGAVSGKTAAAPQANEITRETRGATANAEKCWFLKANTFGLSVFICVHPWSIHSAFRVPHSAFMGLPTAR
jgi:hypothetical protein